MTDSELNDLQTFAEGLANRMTKAELIQLINLLVELLAAK